jgi:hypothetical protein
VDPDKGEIRHQVAGVVERIAEDVIEIRQANGSTFTLPPAPEAFQPAEPGAVYTLNSTGEVVDSPAFWASFNVNAPAVETNE